MVLSMSCDTYLNLKREEVTVEVEEEGEEKEGSGAFHRESLYCGQLEFNPIGGAWGTHTSGSLHPRREGAGVFI